MRYARQALWVPYVKTCGDETGDARLHVLEERSTWMQRGWQMVSMRSQVVDHLNDERWIEYVPA